MVSTRICKVMSCIPLFHSILKYQPIKGNLKPTQGPQMGSIAREPGVLKLVHPGRHVEIYTRPITAAVVLKNYPRHSVTRPDVFEYPWVVVKPESVLNLGKVFFLVPNRTIYSLLKAHEKSHQHSPHKRQSPTNCVNDQVQNQDSPLKSHAGSTPKHPDRRQRQLDQSPPTTSCMCITSLDQGSDLRNRKQNKVRSWPEVVKKHKNSFLRLEDKPVKDSIIKIRSSNHEQDSDIETEIFADFHRRNNYDNLEFQHSSREVTMLKSCLRKPGSVRKFLRLKVSFLLPDKDRSSREE